MQAILERQKQLKEGNIDTFFSVYSEGTVTSGVGMIPFKKGTSKKEQKQKHCSSYSAPQKTSH